MKAIVLAGGFGTRLRSVAPDIPKPMVPIAGKPFLSILLENLSKYGIKEVILSVGYKSEVIEDCFGGSFKGLTINYSIEDKPLGTGGAVKKALNFISDEDVLLLNGDTFFDIDLSDFMEIHKKTNASMTVALKYLEYFDRYGAVICDGDKIVRFEEKAYKEKGYINGGVYALKTGRIDWQKLPDVFSFEKDILENMTGTSNIKAYKSEGYFIDIGIPEDYSKAQKELSREI